MDIKIEKPIETYEDENDIFKYGQSIMQSYNNITEVSILKNINLSNDDKNIFLFGLFDGHNGSEISNYLSLHFSQFLSENTNFINGNYKASLEETFINIDYSLRSNEVQLELSKYNNQKFIKTENGIFNNFLELFNPRNLEGVNVAEFCGSCGIVILITEKSIFLANSGNSKCIPINMKNEVIKDKINKEHDINNEKEIKRLNMIYGFDNDDNIKEKYYNICPLINTRGFGDLQYKDNKMINLEDQHILIKPDIIEIPLDDIKYLIIGNYGCFRYDNGFLSLEKFFIDKYIQNKKENIKISDIIEDFFDEKLKEIEKNKEEDILYNNLASIIIEFKHDNNINNKIYNEEKEDNKDKENNIDKNNNSDEYEEEENL